MTIDNAYAVWTYKSIKEISFKKILIILPVLYSQLAALMTVSAANRDEEVGLNNRIKVVKFVFYSIFGKYCQIYHTMIQWY